MTPFGLLRVCSAAALAAGSIGVAMPAATDNKCNVRYSATEVVFTVVLLRNEHAKPGDSSMGRLSHIYRMM